MSNHKKHGRIFGIVNGMTDQGKSYFNKNYLIPKIKKHRPVIVLDVVGEYDGQQFTSFEKFERLVLDRGSYPSGVSVIKFDKERTAKKIIKFIRHNETPVCFVIEEAHMLFDILDSKTKTKLQEICYLGAHHGFSVILSTQQPKSLSKSVRTQADFIVSFKQTEPADLNYLRKKSGSNKDCREIVASLQKKQFYCIGKRPKGFDEIKINEVNKL